MRTIARANAPDGLVDDVVGVFGRTWFTTGVHFSKILLQLLRQFAFPFIG
jgi:hypothetical protein